MFDLYFGNSFAEIIPSGLPLTALNHRICRLSSSIKHLWLDMPRFKERAAQSSTNALGCEPVDPGHSKLIAKRYRIKRRLGRGSFGTIYLVQDTKVAAGDRL